MNDNFAVLAFLEDQKHALARAAAPDDLRDLEYLDVHQAARYCRLAVSEFRKQAKLYKIPNGTALGTTKRLYRKHDLRKAIEWQGFGQEVRTGSSRGRSATMKQARGKGDLSALVDAARYPATTRSGRSKSSSAISSSKSTGSQRRAALRSIAGGKTT